MQMQAAERTASERAEAEDAEQAAQAREVAFRPRDHASSPVRMLWAADRSCAHRLAVLIFREKQQTAGSRRRCDGGDATSIT